MGQNAGSILQPAIDSLEKAEQELQRVIGLQVVGRPLTPEEQAAIKAAQTAQPQVQQALQTLQEC